MTIAIALLYGTFFYKKAHVPSEGGPPGFKIFCLHQLYLVLLVIAL